MDLRDAAAYHALLLNVEGATEATVKNYLFYWNKLIDYCECNGIEPNVNRFSTHLVRDALLWYREHAAGRRGGAVGVRQFAQRMNTVGAMLIREKIIPRSAYDPVRLPRVSKQLREPYTRTEIAAMCQAAQASHCPERDEALLLLLLDTGMRIGEAATLILAQVDITAHQLIVSDQGKGRQERLVPFGDSGQRGGGRTVQALKKYIGVRPGSAFDHGRLFLSHDGYAMRATGMSEIIMRLGDAAGVKNPIPHRLRHTFATWYLVQYPGDEIGLRRIMGHLSKEVLTDYVHFASHILAQRVGRASLSDQWLGASRGRAS